MHKFATGVSVVLLLAQAGSRNQNPAQPAAAPRPDSEKLRVLSSKAFALFGAAEYRRAAEAYELSYKQALEDNNPAAAVRELNNLGSARQAILAFQDSLRAYLEAKRIAQQANKQSIIPVIDANIAQIYLSMGDLPNAIRLGELALPGLTGPLQPYRTLAINVIGTAYRLSGDLAKGELYFRQAAQEADAAGDVRVVALALDRLGDTALDAGRLDDAEEYFSQAFRLRSYSFKGDLYLSYPRIARVLSETNRSSEALRFFDLAIASQRTDPKSLPLPTILGWRAGVRAKSGDEEGALADYRAALSALRTQRLEIVPVGAMQATWEGSLHTLRSSFIRLAAERSLRTHDRELALESLVAAEESRLASMRSSEGMPKWQSKLPSGYWERLAALRRAEASRQSSESVLTKLRFELTELEANAGLAAGWVALPPEPAHLARNLRDNLADDEAIVSFHLDEPASYVWFVTTGKVDLARLPGKAAISEAIAAYRSALDTGSGTFAESGTRAYNQIFREIPRAAATKPFWTIVSDDRLFDLPFAALPGGSGGGEFLVEKHAIREAPSAFLTAKRERRQPGLFVGVGDPIYNRADERMPQAPRLQSHPMELPRLLSSGTEVDRCARAWPGASWTLKGAEITPANLNTAVAKSPAVLHFATHFVRSAENRERAMMSLGLNPPSFEPELVGADQIAALSLKGGIVTMSGCHSGAGETIRGAGLMGLTRSWLIAGANAVTGTYWPTPDDSGELFVHFYEAYAKQPAALPIPEAAALSLQQAQIAMIRAQGWRRSPRYWGAYFLMTKG